MCRHPWGVDEAEDLLLLDLEEFEGSDSEDDTGSLVWASYRDPVSNRAYWVTTNEELGFFVGDPFWTRYCHGGREWWHNAIDDAQWFYADTGTQH